MNTKQYLSALSKAAASMDCSQIDNLGDELFRATQRGAHIYVMGNGGSALTASHFVTDWCKSGFVIGGHRVLAHSLSDNIGLLTAYANDIAYEDIFVSRLKNDLTPNDVALAVSGSGNSANVVRAVEYANALGATTLAIVGFDGGKLKKLAKHVLHVEVHDMQIVEDLHLAFGHMFMKRLCAIKGD